MFIDVKTFEDFVSIRVAGAAVLFRGNDSSDLKVFFQSLDSARKLRRRCFRQYRVAVLTFLENGKVSNDFR